MSLHLGSSRISLTIVLLTVAGLGAVGCSSSPLNIGKSKPFAKGEQWEPDTDEPKADWRAEAGKLGRGNRRYEAEDPIDKLLWSEQAREINQNMGFR